MRSVAKVILNKLRSLVLSAPELVAKGLTLGALLAIAFGAGYSTGQHKTNVATVQHAAKLVAQANRGQTTTVPATIKPSPVSVHAYTVAPDRPRYITIPRLSIHARVRAVGLTAGGAIGTPDNVYDTAWYTHSSKPGQPGAALVDGHVSSWTAHGVFYDLGKLKPGDVIQVERGDGVVFTYHVVKTRVYDAASVDMNASLSPIVAGKPGLNLMTCTGKIIPGTNDFNQRIVVFATQD